jgi:hypothetical protein
MDRLSLTKGKYSVMSLRGGFLLFAATGIKRLLRQNQERLAAISRCSLRHGRSEEDDQTRHTVEDYAEIVRNDAMPPKRVLAIARKPINANHLKAFFFALRTTSSLLVFFF